MASEGSIAVLEESRNALTAAAAEGDDAALAAHVLEDGGGLAGQIDAGGGIGVAESDGTAADVQLVKVDAHGALDPQSLGGQVHSDHPH